MPIDNICSSLNHEWTVLVWDNQSSRVELIDRVISACGAKLHLVERLTDIDALQCFPIYCSAIVALGACPMKDSLGLEVIRRLKDLGFSVISHEQGADSWALGVRCQALLAGAVCTLDSGKIEFAEELQRTLMEILVQKVSEQKEEKKIKKIMNSLGIIGESDAMLSTFRQILKISPFSNLPVLITGESGTGKELIARAFHQLDPNRCNGPFIAINCGAISPNVAESELFGHKRGAFTGADRDRRGLIRSAHEGVLFLDEIGELNRSLQAKLLRVLQENTILSVGDDQEVSVDFRIIAATNRDLEREVEREEFRLDLFHRLNVLSIHICPLRERTTDIKPLVEHFLNKYRSITTSSIIPIDQDFIDAVSRLRLLGNARELENLVRKALVNKQGGAPLGLSDLPTEIWQQLCMQQEYQTGAGSRCETREVLNISQSSYKELNSIVQWLDSNDWNLSHALDNCERLLLEAALHHTHGNQTQTAGLLGITPRSVYNKLRKHHLDH